jgi:hypothetical protein
VSRPQGAFSAVIAPIPRADLDQLIERIDRELTQAIKQEEAELAGFASPATNEDYCGYSELRHEHCAHCLGHYIDPELEEASKP